MKKTALRAAAVILAAVMAFCCLPFAASAAPAARLKNVYGSNMLFQQNEPAIFSGSAPAGSVVKAELTRSGETVASGKSEAASDGSFEVSFTAPEGGFEEYEVSLQCNGAEFAKLTGVVFGELWVASGQSNMQYNLGGTIDGIELLESGRKISPWIRALNVPAIPGSDSDGNYSVPLEPNKDIEGAYWTKGNESGIAATSAVAFFFADKLYRELGVPVGVLSIPLGGSSIVSWISREGAENDPAVKKDLEDTGKYVSASDWKADEHNAYFDIAGNYNLKIEALSSFRPAGMIWYQGETDISWGNDRYAHAFDLMQREHTEVFGHEDGLLPIIYTQIADYDGYGTHRSVTSPFNESFGTMALERPESRSCMTIYDVPLDYIREAHRIHPGLKKPVGERMAKLAGSLVYGNEGLTTAATLKDSYTRDGSVYAVIENAGSGLVCGKGDKLKGFAIAGADGIYVQAEAEIVSKDTVRIYSPYVKEPASAAYAYSMNNQSANMYSAEDGEAFMPVSPFITAPDLNAEIWLDPVWADCGTQTAWHCGEEAGYYDTWTSDKAEISFDGGIKAVSSDKGFTLSPVLTYKNGVKKVIFEDAFTSLAPYSSIRVKIKSDTGVGIKGLKIKGKAPQYYFAKPSVTEIAAGETAEVVFDLNELYILGNTAAKLGSNDKLIDVTDIDIMFEGEEGCDVILESVEFTPDADGPAYRGARLVKPADGRIFDLFTAVFLVVFDWIVNLFIR